MVNINEKNTKKEILDAYLSAKETIIRLEKEAEEATIEKKNVPVLIQDKVTVCIPFVAEFAQANELQLALRGWEKHFKEDFNVVIIGNRLPWMSKELDVIECKRIGDNPPVDVANKMLLAIDSELVTEKFIWANDDQYLVSPSILADFETLKCTGQLEGANFGSSLYQRNKKKTYELLKKAGKSTWDYSSHTPFVFEKEKLKELIVHFKMTEEAYLIATMYFNWVFNGFVPYNAESRAALLNDNLKVGVYRANADFDLLKNLIPGKKIVNNSERGWTDQFAQILNDLFPEKCRFEK